MNAYLPNIRNALILTPAILLLTIWLLVLSGSNLIASIGLLKAALWALIISFGSAYSVAIFANEVRKEFK